MRVWTLQPKRIIIRKAKKPCEKGFISGVAIYKHNKEVARCYIDYLPPTERMIAEKMPMGIGPAHPAYLFVHHIQNVYRVYCCYLEDEYRLHLWTQVEKPVWV